MNNHFQARPLVFGEVLYDVFEDEREVLGGAPFNVAWHLRGFGLDPLFVGRVGVDERGERAREQMAHWNLDSSAVQDDLVHDTGVVHARVENGAPRYEIVADRAWDFVDGDRALAEMRLHEISMLYHGTLALRGPRSRRSLERMRAAIEAPVYCDVNLRDPWTPIELVHESLAAAQIAKLNDEELARLTRADCSDAAVCIEAAQVLRARHALELVVVTRGEYGAVAVSDGEHWSIDAHPIEHLVDTVGAGDAFSAVLMIGWIEAWPMPVTLARASRFAAAICAVRGATTDDRRLHLSHRELWDKEEESHDAL